MPPGETRAEVKSELNTARKEGEVPLSETGEKPREINPKSYPPQPTEPGLTRAQVRADTQAAIRAGDVQVGETGETLAQQNPSRYAGSPAKPPKLNLHLPHKAKPTATAASAPAN